MPNNIVVIGTGYAGANAVQQLEQHCRSADITWVGEQTYHLVLHEAHRAIGDPTVGEKITIPINDIKTKHTKFVNGKVTGINTDTRSIELANGTDLDYDYTLVAIGSQTAYYGIPGLAEHAYTLKSLNDALTIREQIRDSADTASSDDPAHILIGGAGLSGVQIAGEVAMLQDKEELPIEISLLEALDEILPGQDSDLQRSVRQQLNQSNVDIRTGDPITEAEDGRVWLEDDNSVSYDVLVWTGGITGHDIMEPTNIDTKHNRIKTDTTFQTADERVFAVGDAAFIENSGSPVPPTAQAAWQAADVAAENIAHSIDGQPLTSWTYENKGTLISIGDDAIAHGISIAPVSTFGSYPARFLKKFVAARWIAGLTSWPRALSTWDAL